MVKSQNVADRIIASNAVSFEDGEFRMMGITGMPFPLPSVVFIQTLLEQTLGEKRARDVVYTWAKVQAYNACKIMATKFGISNQVKLTEAVLGHFPLVGGGIMDVVRVDYEKKEIVLRNKNTPFAKGYRMILGSAEQPVDNFVRGLAAGLFEYIFNDSVTAIEKQCIAQGNAHCVFEVKTTAACKEDASCQNQIPSDEFDFEKLKKTLRINHFFAE